MKVLIVLLSTFIISIIISHFLVGDWNIIFSGNLAMMLMLCFSSLGHFMYTDGMVMMMPGFIPFKRFVVYFTGVLEPTLGIALLFNVSRPVAGITLLIMLVLMLPANINAAVKHVSFEKATYDGNGPTYLWFRVPLQLLFIGWVLYFSIGI
jgi:uncharacterized membrane protein